MQTIKTYIKKVKLINPITLFKNWLLTDLMVETERLDHRVDRLENQANVEDVENRVDNLEYYDLDDIQERAENAERKAEENEARIELVEDRSETNQESIKHLKDKIDQLWAYDEMFKILKDDIKTIKKVDFAGIADRFDELDERVEDNKLKIVQTQIDLQCDKNNLEYLTNEPTKQERTEGNLSAMQKLTFEVCKYYGGDFNLDDFNNCYEIINKYNVKEVK
jgi:chromosome segregation ATPase